MKAVILASGVSRPRKPGKSSMGFAEVLQIRQRHFARWRNPEHSYQQRFLTNQTHIEEALGSEFSEEELDERFRKRNLSPRVIAREIPIVLGFIKYKGEL
ncbi:MAG: hypothetical protein NTZ94_01090 [Verrucomicrobia bacterium]|nr:hypothetical protein [Verrucomicrobiota bacterium]